MRLARLVLVSMFLLGAKAQATWSLYEQAAATCTTTSATCSASFIPAGPITAAGDVVIIVVGIATDDRPISATDDATGGSSTYTMPASCYANDVGSVNHGACGYALNAHAGATTFTVNRSTTTSAGWQLRILIFRSTVTSVSLDGIAILNTSVAALSTSGPSLTLTGTNCVVVQWSRSNANAITAPYTFVTAWTIATVGYVMNSSTAPAPTWTQATSTRAAAGAIAVREGGVAVHQPKIDVITENRLP